jgi:hypothetical protein
VLEVPEHVLRASENSPHDSTPSPLETVALHRDRSHHFLLQRAWVVIMWFSRGAMHDYLDFSFRNETQPQASQALKGLK